MDDITTSYIGYEMGGFKDSDLSHTINLDCHGIVYHERLPLGVFLGGNLGILFGKNENKEISGARYNFDLGLAVKMGQLGNFTLFFTNSR